MTTQDYSELLTSQPWKAFNAYRFEVNQALIKAKSSQNSTRATSEKAKPLKVALIDTISSKPIPITPRCSLEAITMSFVSEARVMFEALPEREKNGLARQRCAGLPRVYPKKWMRRAHSNSVMMEYRLLQNKHRSMSVEELERAVAIYELARLNTLKREVGI